MGESKRISAWGFRDVIVLVVLLGLFVWVSVNMPSFVKEPVASPANVCINNLRQIDGAKNEWALENGETNGDVCTENDIKNFIKLDLKGNLPKCPQGGTYTIGKIGEPPTCSLGKTKPGHVLSP